ncbi:MFS transporter [Cohnella boryungensis]|uniref:MFS transporter n=1 Tax=Cohnella boryungensis TaxID=768479 RepID=A0ABV8SAU5_9BACL
MDKDKARQDGRLDGQTLLLLIVNGLFLTASALSGTYFGIYIWKASNDFFRLGSFTLITHLAMGITFWIAGNAAKEGNKMTVMRLGIAVYVVFYGAVLLLKESAIHYTEVLGIVQGIAMGLFWLAFNVIYFEATEPDNRDRFNGWAGTIGSLIGIAVPWSSGLIISRMGGASGYRAIFLLSLGIYVGAIAVSFFLRNRRTSGNYDWRWVYPLLRNRRTDWRSVLGALTAQGVRESVFGVLIGVLIYIQTGSELKLGNFMLVTSAVGFVSFLLAGKWLTPRWRNAGMLIGAIALAAAVLPLVIGISYGSLLAFGVGAALFFPLYTLPMTASVFDLIGQDEDSVRRRVEYVVARELALNLGRVAGMVLFLCTISVSRAPAVMNALLLVAGSSPLISWLFMRRRLSSASEQIRVEMKPKGAL